LTDHHVPEAGNVRFGPTVHRQFPIRLHSSYIRSA
jgi:hypothetical protein